ncbi:E3 ubiquitin-protein ligase [Canna indica]|uniref:E3 ubiquitin-protein ligase RNF170 n=1 Tax=Canna indica TaxID=4628 RepID=A0AAQ3L3H0_9LILI|nr:E3 ubiquitin-protein ligase [Canna indica]
MDAPPENDICSICRGGFRLPCRSNCSRAHWFCGDCFVELWNHGPVLQPCQCPICRGTITRLTPTDAEEQEPHKAEASQVLKIIHRYNHLFSGDPYSISQKLWDLPFLIRRLSRQQMHQQWQLPLVYRVQIHFAMILTAMYVLSPLDFVPEEAYGFVGLLDDLLVFLLFLLLIVIIYCWVLFHHRGH